MPFLVPVLTAIGLALGASTAAAFAVGLTVVLTAASVALGFIEKALAPSFKSPQQAAFAHDAQSRTVTVRQPVAPWRVIYGFVGQLGGVITFIAVNGSSNQYIHLVVTMAGHQVNNFPTMYFDGVAVPLDSLGNATGTFAGLVHVEFNLGSSSQAAFPGLVAAGVGWTSNHRQRGRAGVYIRLKWNADKFPNGVPNITFDVQGHANVFDPRISASGYSQNAALCLREFLTNSSYGLSCLTAEINDTQAIVAANNCEEAVALAAGGTEQRYTCNGVFDTSQATGDTIRQLMSAMAGEVSYIGGQWNIFSGVYRAPDPTALTDGDARDLIKVQARLSLRDTANGIKGLFLCPQNKWQPADYPAYSDATYVTEDNGQPIWKELDLPFTTSAATAQRLAKIALELIRRQISVDFKAKLIGYKFQPADSLKLTHPRFSWTDKVFRVTQAQLALDQDAQSAPLLGVDLTLREHDSTVYDWSTTLEKPVAVSSSTLPGDFNTGYIINVSSAPSTPYNGDFEQFADMQPVADGWEDPFDQVLSGNVTGAILGGSTSTTIVMSTSDAAKFTAGDQVVCSAFPTSPTVVSSTTSTTAVVSPALPGTASGTLIKVVPISMTRSLAPYTGTYAQKFSAVNSASDSFRSIASRPFEVRGKKRYVCQVRAKADAASTMVALAYVAWFSDDTDISVSSPYKIAVDAIGDGSTIGDTAWHTYTKELKAPPTAKYARVVLTYQPPLAGGAITYDRVSVIPSDEFTQTGELFGSFMKALWAAPANSASGGGTGAANTWQTGDAVTGLYSLDVAITSGGNNVFLAPIPGLRYKVQGGETFRACIKLLVGTPDEVAIQFHRYQDNTWHTVYWGASEHFGTASPTQKSTTVPGNSTSFTELVFTAGDLGLSAGDIVDGLALDVWKTSGTADVRFSDILGQDDGNRRSYWNGGPDSSPLNDQGGLVITPNNPITYTAPVPGTTTTAQIVFSWGAFTGERWDIGQAPIPSGTQTFSNLTHNKDYYFRAYYDIAKNIVVIVISSQGTPAGTAPEIFPNTMDVNRDGRVAVKVNFVAHTATVGGAGGSGGAGGDPTCPALDQECPTLEKGIVPASEIESGMHLADIESGVWNLVHEAVTEEKELVWVEVGDDRYHVEIGHLWLRAGGDAEPDSQDWVRTYDLTLNTLIEAPDGQTLPVRSLSRPEPGQYRRIRCERGRFLLAAANRPAGAGILGHNGGGMTLS